MTARAKPVICLMLMLGWVALLWLLEGVDVLTGGALDTFGIQPRDPAELVDIVPAAFMHFGFGHLAADCRGRSAARSLRSRRKGGYGRTEGDGRGGRTLGECGIGPTGQ